MENMMITDKQIRASSEYSHHFKASYGRLNSRGCWIAKGSDSNPWLQIDLVKHNYIVTGVATQGRKCKCRQRVTSYYLQYNGPDDETFQDYKAHGQTTRKVRRFEQMKKMLIPVMLITSIAPRKVFVLPTGSKSTAIPEASRALYSRGYIESNIAKKSICCHY